MVVRANRAYPEQVGLVYDLAYLSLLDGHWLLPEGTVEPRRVDRRFAELRSTFDRYDCWSKYCFVMLEFFPGTDDPDRIAQLRRQWRKEILRHLKSYLQMKVKLARIDYSFGTGEVLYAFHPGVDPNSLGVTLRATALNTSVMSFLNAIRNSVLFQAWVYLAALLAVLAGVLITNPRRHLDVLFVGLGALAKDLVYLVWWPSYDFRYHFWTVICVLAIPLMLLARNRDSRRAASPEEPVPDGTRDSSD